MSQDARLPVVARDVSPEEGAAGERSGGIGAGPSARPGVVAARPLVDDVDRGDDADRRLVAALTAVRATFGAAEAATRSALVVGMVEGPDGAPVAGARVHASWAEGVRDGPRAEESPWPRSRSVRLRDFLFDGLGEGTAGGPSLAREEAILGALRARGPETAAETLTDARGAFSLAVPEGRAVEIRARAPGAWVRAAHDRGRADEGAPRVVSFTAEPLGGRLTVRARPPAEEVTAHPALAVSLRHTDDRRETELPSGGGATTASTAHGEIRDARRVGDVLVAEFHDLPQGIYEAVALSDGLPAAPTATVSLGAAPLTAEIALPPLAREGDVEARVVDATGRAPAGRVQAHMYLLDAAGRDREVLYLREPRPLADGRLHFRSYEPAKVAALDAARPVRLSVHASDQWGASETTAGALREGAVVVRVAPTAILRVRVEVGPGGASPPASVSARLRCDRSPEPARARRPLDEVGCALFEGVAPALTEVLLERHEVREGRSEWVILASREVAIGPGENDLAITLEAPSEAAFRVPAAGEVRIWRFEEGRGWRLAAEVDAPGPGRVVVPGLTPGAYAAAFFAERLEPSPPGAPLPNGRVDVRFTVPLEGAGEVVLPP